MVILLWVLFLRIFAWTRCVHVILDFIWVFVRLCCVCVVDDGMCAFLFFASPSLLTFPSLRTVHLRFHFIIILSLLGCCCCFFYLCFSAHSGCNVFFFFSFFLRYSHVSHCISSVPILLPTSMHCARAHTYISMKIARVTSRSLLFFFYLL